MPSRDTLRENLKEGIAALELSVPPDAPEKMLDFLEWLQKWNAAYNLTSITDPEEMLRGHLLDSLTALPYVRGKHVLDVGSGAGFPGIPLAMCLPDVSFTLLDTNGKKARFLLQTTSRFKLSNVEVVHARMESYRPARLFDAMICRALGAMPDIIQATAGALNPGGSWLFMKGRCPDTELQQISSSAAVHSLRIPGREVERHMVVINKE